MSKQSGKKKRIGSRRHGVNHRNTNETDEFLVADRISVTEHRVLEDDKESAFAKPDDLQSQTASSPELTGNRRKLGSSRRHKGGRPVKDSETESHHQPREEVEEKTEGEESPETTQMSPETQHKQGNFSSKDNEHEIVSRAQEGPLYFSEELQKVKESKGREESTEIIRLDGNSQSSSMSESNVESLAQPLSPTLGLTEQSECNIQWAELSASSKELTPAEQQKENVNLPAEVNDAWQSEEEMKIGQLQGTDDENLMRERLPTERISENLIDQAEPSYTYQYKFESTDGSTKHEVLNIANKQEEQHKKEDAFEIFVDKAEDYHVSDLRQPQIGDTDNSNNELDQVDEKASGFDDMKPQVEQTFQEMEKSPSGADLSSSSLQMLQSEMESYFDTFVTRDEQDFDCRPIENRRKLGSSRKHKIKQIKDSATESYLEPTQEVVENKEDEEGLETEVSLPIEKALHEKSEERALEEMTLNTSLFEKLCCHVENQPLLDILDEESTQNQPENESIVEKNTVLSSKQSFTLEEQSETSTLSEVRGAHQSEEAVNIVLEPDFHLTKSQEVLETVYFSEILTPNVVKHLEIFSGNPVKQDKVSDKSEFTMRSSDDSVAKQEVSNLNDTYDEHTTKVINIESFGHRKEEYERSHISNDKKEDKALDQLYTTEGKVEDDVNHSSDHTGYLEKEEFLNLMDSKSFQALPGEISLNSQHPQTNSSVILTAAEMCQGPKEQDNVMSKDDEPAETTKTSLKVETTVEEISIESNMVDSDTFDIVHMKEASNQLKRDDGFGKVVDASGLTSLNFLSAVDQKLVELSTKIPDEKLHKITVIEQGHREENKFSKPDVNLQGNSWVNEQHLNSEEQDSLLQMEGTTENLRPQSGAEVKWGIEHEEFPSQKEEWPKDKEQNEIFRSCEAAGVLNSKDTAVEVHRKGEEVKQALVQEIDYPSEKVTDDSRENSDSLSGHPKDQVSDLYQTDLLVERTDLVTVQDNPNPDDNVLSNHEKVLFEDEDNKSVKTQQSEMIPNLEDSAMEYRESARAREKLETSQLQLETETLGQEEFSQKTDFDVSITVPYDSTSNLAITHCGLQNPSPSNYPEKNLESPISGSENLQDDQDVKPLQMQEKHDIDGSAQSVLQSPNISKEIVLENLKEEPEVSYINQPELTIKNSFDRPGEQEDFHLYGRHEDHPGEPTIPETFDQANDDQHPGENVTETHVDEGKPTQMHDKQGDINSTVEESVYFAQALHSEINVTSDSESQQLNPMRNRRKLGSSRRNKRQQHVEKTLTETLHEPKQERTERRNSNESLDIQTTEMSSSAELSGHPKDQVSDLYQPDLLVESTDFVTVQDNSNPDDNVLSNHEKVLFEDEDNKSVKTQQSEMIPNLEDSAMEYRESARAREKLETSQLQLETETLGQEEFSQKTDFDASITVPYDSTSNLAITHCGLQNPSPSNYPEKNLESPISGSENLQDDQDVKPLQMQEKHDIDGSAQSVLQSPNISKEIVLENLKEEPEVSYINQPELTIKNSFDRPGEQGDFHLYGRHEDHPGKSTISETFEQANDDQHPGENVTETHENEGKPTQMHDKQGDINSTVEESVSFAQAVHSEINVTSDSESQQLNPMRNRRKLGSSRRNKRQQHVEKTLTETLHEPKQERTERRNSNESLDIQTTEMSSSAELSGHPKDQVSDLYQPDLLVESTDLVTVQDNSNPDDNVLSNHEKVLFEDEDNKSVKTQQSEMIPNLEDSAMEYRESARAREKLETSQLQLETETLGQEEFSQKTDFDVSITVPHDGTSNLAITHCGLQNPSPSNYPEKNLESPISGSENLQDDQDVKPLQMQEKHDIDSSAQSVLQSPNISKEIVLENLKEEPEVSYINQPELTIKNSFDRPGEQGDFHLYDRLEDHPGKSTISETFEQANDDQHPGENITETHVDEGKPTQMHNKQGDINSTVEESVSFAQALLSEINVTSDSESQQLNPMRNRRKLGSSRRNKRQQHVEKTLTETLHEPKQERTERRSSNESLDIQTTEMSSSAELSGHPKDQVSDLYQTDLLVESTDLVTVQDNPNPDYNVLSNHEKVLFEDEDNKSVKTQQSEMIPNLEDSAMEYRESARARGELETSQMQLETETLGQGEFSQKTEFDVSITVPHDGTSNLAVTHCGLQNPTPSNYPEKNLESPIPESENPLDQGAKEREYSMEECYKSMLVALEGMDTSGSFQDEDTNGPHHSEDAFHDQDVKPHHMQEKHDIDSSAQSVLQSPNISKEIVLENMKEEAEVSDINQPELTIRNSFDRPGEQEDFHLYGRHEDHPGEPTIPETFDQANDDQHPGENVTETHVDEGKPTQMQDKQGDINSTVEESVSFTQALQSEINVTSDSESQQLNPNGNPMRNRRKLGSSRRSKRQQHVEKNVTETLQKPKEECVQKRDSNEALDIKTTEFFSAIDKKKEGESEEDFQFNPFVEVRNDNSNTGFVLLQNLKDNRQIVKTVFSPSFGQDDSVGEKEGINDLNNISQPTELIQSPALKDDFNTENIPCHDDIDFIRPFPSDSLEQKDDCHIQNKEPSPHDEDKINTQQTDDTVETVGHVRLDDYKTEDDTEVDVPVSGNEEFEHFKDLVKRDQDTENIMASWEITASPQSGLFSTTHKTESLASLDTTPVVNPKAEQAVDVAEGSGSENFEEKSKQRKRKFGSNRRILFKENLERAQEKKNEDKEADIRSLEKMKVLEDIPRVVTAEAEKQLETQETISHLDLGQNLQGSTRDPQGLENDIISDKNLVTEDSANSNMTGENSVPSDKTTLGSQSNAERPESAIVLQHQALKSATELVVTVTDLEIVPTEVTGAEEQNTESSIQESNNVDEEAHNTNPEMNNASPNLTHRRRKMGSTRKNLNSKTKEDGLHQKPKIDNEGTETTTNAEDVKTDYFSGNKEEDSELKADQGGGYSEQKKAKGLQQVEFSHISESHLIPTPLGTSKDNHGPNNQIEHNLTPNYLPAIQSTTPELDAMPEASSAGRRRKFGSNRKSRGQQNNKNQTAREEKIIETESGSDDEGVTNGSADKTNEKETSEVENTKEEASPGIGTLKGGDNSAPESEKKSQQVTQVQQPSAGIHQSQEDQKTFSLVNSKEAVNRSNSYNVVMVGDSCVGKTAFMKRAVVGKFSKDLPASCGIDTCLGTVVVDGKVVMLQLWDTAGQERFQSITRQIFHRAQAFLLMYDITSSHSFSAVSYWASCIQDGAAEDVTVLLLGNKSDLTDRQVTFQQGETLAKEHNFDFMECSAANGENVIQSLESVARMLSQKADTREETTVLLKEPQKKKSSGCC